MKRRILLISFILCLISFAIIVPIYSKWLFLIEIDKYQLDQLTGLSKTTISHNYDVLMHYLLNPFQAKLSMPNFVSSKSGLKHFRDVKILFQLVQAIFWVTIIPSICFIRNLVRKKQLWQLMNPMRILMIVPIVLAFLMSLGFETFFIKFHEIFFNDSTWLFDPTTDPIILVLPEQYFMHCFILGFVLLECLAVFFYFWGKRSLSR